MSNFLYQRNLGIGRMLVMKVVEHARSIGCQKVYLATWRTMYSATALYTKCGFQNIGNRSSKVFFKGLPMKYIFPILGERIPEFILDIFRKLKDTLVDKSSNYIICISYTKSIWISNKIHEGEAI